MSNIDTILTAICTAAANDLIIQIKSEIKSANNVIFAMAQFILDNKEMLHKEHYMWLKHWKKILVHHTSLLLFP